MLEFHTYSRPRLRVVGVTPNLAPGGAEIWLSTLCRHAQTVAYKALVCCSGPLDLQSHLPSTTHIRIADEVSQEAIARKVHQTIAEFGADLVFFWGQDINLSGLDIPVVHISHGNAAEAANQGHKEYCYHLGKMPCNFMAGCCESSLSLFSEQFRSMARPVVLYNGSDLERVSPVFGRDKQREFWGVAPESKVMTYIGRFYPGKGADTAIEALSLLPDDWHLVMYGWGREDERLRKLAFGKFRRSATGSRSRVFWPVPRLAQLGDLYAASDCIVLPSRSEAFPLVMIEAWQAACPLVISEIATLREIESRYNQGEPMAVSVPRPPSADELAEGVLQSQDHEGRYSLERAQLIAATHFSASAMVGRWESYWYECVRCWHEHGLRGITRTSHTTDRFDRETLWTGDP